MAAAVSIPFIDGAPANVITVPGTGLAPTGTTIPSVTLSNQGVNAPLPDPPGGGLTPITITVPATFAPTAVTIGPLPDGITDGELTITVADGSTATLPLRACSQYVQAFEYQASGEGITTSALQAGELDNVLRRASTIADEYMLEPIRLLQKLEEHKYSPPRNEQPPRLMPFRQRGRADKCPLVSVDQLTFISAQDLVTAFQTTDVYVNTTTGYIEILAYAVGNYALLGALQVIGYSANVFQLAYTSGYRYSQYPSAIRQAVTMIATALLVRRNLLAANLGGITSYDKSLIVTDGSAGADFVIPPAAKRLLKPYVCSSVS